MGRGEEVGVDVKIFLGRSITRNFFTKKNTVCLDMIQVLFHKICTFKIKMTFFFPDITATPSSSKSTAYLPSTPLTQTSHSSSSVQSTLQQSSSTTLAMAQQSSTTTRGISQTFTIPTTGTVPQTMMTITTTQTQNNGPGTI